MLIWVLLTPSEEGLACSVPAGWVGIQRETGSLPKIPLPTSPPTLAPLRAKWQRGTGWHQETRWNKGQAQCSNRMIKGNWMTMVFLLLSPPRKVRPSLSPPTLSSATHSVTFDIKGFLIQLLIHCTFYTLPSHTQGIITAAFNFP